MARMKPIDHVKNALAEISARTQAIVMDPGMNLTEKDNKMLPLLQQQKVLKQTLKDLEYLEAHPPSPNQPCGISKYRDDA